MASSGGSREIEAARQRLAASETRASSAAKMMESAEETKQSARTMIETATKMMETAKNMMETAIRTSEAAQFQLESSRQEMEAADTFLAEAEQRWEVIEVDVKSESQGNESRKKRKVSMSPNAVNVDIIISTVNRAAVQQTRRLIQAESGEGTSQALAMFGHAQPQQQQVQQRQQVSQQACQQQHHSNRLLIVQPQQYTHQQAQQRMVEARHGATAAWLARWPNNHPPNNNNPPPPVDTPPAPPIVSQPRDAAVVPYGSPSETTFFPMKLYNILRNPDFHHAISWQPHGRSWKVHKKDFFMQNICPRYFAQTQYESFTRQVNGWGFRRIMRGREGLDRSSYYHDHFLRGCPDGIERMRRPAKGEKWRDVKEEPDFYAVPAMPQLAVVPRRSSPPPEQHVNSHHPPDNYHNPRVSY